MNQPTKQFTIVPLSQKQQNYPTEQVAFFGADGTPLIVGVPQTGATVKMTGYTPPTGGTIAATDTLNAALAKIETRLHAGSL